MLIIWADLHCFDWSAIRNLIVRHLGDFAS